MVETAARESAVLCHLRVSDHLESIHQIFSKTFVVLLDQVSDTFCVSGRYYFHTFKLSIFFVSMKYPIYYRYYFPYFINTF